MIANLGRRRKHKTDITASGFAGATPDMEGAEDAEV